MRVYLFVILLLFFSGCSLIGVSIIDENIVEIDIYNSSFEPSDLVIERGKKVRWENLDNVNHTLIIQGPFEPKTIERGKSYSRTFDDEGEYDYYSKEYPDMKGVIIVQ